MNGRVGTNQPPMFHASARDWAAIGELIRRGGVHDGFARRGLHLLEQLDVIGQAVLERLLGGVQRLVTQVALRLREQLQELAAGAVRVVAPQVRGHRILARAEGGGGPAAVARSSTRRRPLRSRPAVDHTV